MKASQHQHKISAAISHFFCFSGTTELVHKTFHSYTVRAKQGGAQSVRDSKSATSHPKSAGASLRRYNEQVFNQVSSFKRGCGSDGGGAKFIFC